MKARGVRQMEVKTFMLAMGMGAAAGTVMGMMLPKNSEMQKLGKNMTHSAAKTVTKAVDNMEKKMY